MFELRVRANRTDQEKIGPGESALLVRTIGTTNFLQRRQPHQGYQWLPIALHIAIHGAKPERAKSGRSKTLERIERRHHRMSILRQKAAIVQAQRNAVRPVCRRHLDLLGARKSIGDFGFQEK